MKQPMIVLAALLALTACTKTVEEMNYVERRALAEQITQRCAGYGLKAGTPEFRDCSNVEVQREFATRNRRAAVEDSRRSRSTVCNRVGYTVICN